MNAPRNSPGTAMGFLIAWIAVIGSVGEPPANGAVEPGTADAESGEVPVIEHVPIKKKGSRKR